MRRTRRSARRCNDDSECRRRTRRRLRRTRRFCKRQLRVIRRQEKRVLKKETRKNHNKIWSIRRRIQRLRRRLRDAPPSQRRKIRSQIRKLRTQLGTRLRIARKQKIRKAQIVRARRRRCERRVTRLAQRVNKAQDFAKKCGDTDIQCTDNRYRRVFRQKGRLNRARRRCAPRKFSCEKDDLFKWIRTQERRRRRIEKRAIRCADEDVVCTRHNMHQIQRLNERIVRVQNRCQVVALQHIQTIEPRVIKRWVFGDPYSAANVDWKKEFTCVNLKTKFQQWLARQRNIREYWHQEACFCSTSDSSCVRAHYKKIRTVQMRIRRNRSAFARKISNCDECEGIKIKFSRWLARQRRRRHSLHLSVCRCPPRDNLCMQEHVDLIKAIQERIKRRRAQVLAAHGSCVLTVQETPVTTQAPVRRSAIGAATAFGPAMIILILTLAATLF